jgi:hypothetical protein
MAFIPRAPPSRIAAPLAWPRLRLLPALLPLLAAACVTPGGSLRARCESGHAGACSEWGQELLLQGERQQAENAFARSCEGGSTYDCVHQGRLMLERGELDGAEPPLRKGYEAEIAEATWALADLHQARRGPGDELQAAHLRWQALAIDKPDREVIFWWRPSPTGRERSFALAYSFQPMAFFSRRMTLGLHFAGNSRGADELNGAIGYQHFLTPELVPYGTLLLGGSFQRHGFNAGGEVGVKWCLGPYGHLNLGVGTSVASPLHASVGIGINSIPLDLLLLLAAHL